MAFATRSDLLARSNAHRLAQLAVPADMDMVADDALRLAIGGGDLSGLPAGEQDTLALALDAIDKALADADALMLSYGIPAAVQSALLARIGSTIALYYLQGAERMTDDVAKLYEDALGKLTAHAKGTINLIPADPAAPPASGGSDESAVIVSRPGRYGASRYCGADDDLA